MGAGRRVALLTAGVVPQGPPPISRVGAGSSLGAQAWVFSPMLAAALELRAAAVVCASGGLLGHMGDEIVVDRSSIAPSRDIHKLE